jgi:hypothetical protein
MLKKRCVKRNYLLARGAAGCMVGIRTSKQGDQIMRIRDIIADLIGVIAIFGGGYGLLLIGHGMGW